MADSDLVFWQVGFAIALGLVGALLLVCSCLVGGRFYKDEAQKNIERFAKVLKHQGQLWKEERGRREKEYELRLEEQRHKNLAYEQNSQIREDMDDVMEENRVLREQMDEYKHRSEQLELESARLRSENAGLAVQIAQARRPAPVARPEMVLDPGSDRSPNLKSTLFGSGLPPASTFSLEEAVQNGSDSSVSHPSFPLDSEPGTPSRTETPPFSNNDWLGAREPEPVLGMVTKGNPMFVPKQRNTWAAHSASLDPTYEEAAHSTSSRPAHEVDDKWQPASPDKRRMSIH